MVAFIAVLESCRNIHHVFKAILIFQLNVELFIYFIPSQSRFERFECLFEVFQRLG